MSDNACRYLELHSTVCFNCDLLDWCKKKMWAMSLISVCYLSNHQLILKVQILRTFYFAISKLALNCCPELHSQFHFSNCVFLHCGMGVYWDCSLSRVMANLNDNIVGIFIFTALASDRTNQMTKTHNDLDAILQLLQEVS